MHYAHQRGVIHRDLKPTNVVVLDGAETESGVPEIKILDFGLARMTDADVNATAISEVGMIKGTLAYMSPEQARGNPEEIDLRTDVYALGVMLYEMLADTRPYDLRTQSIIEAVRVICDVAPRPLAESWNGDRRLDPDLATIAGKALEKEADLRYGSAAALSGDVGRYLHSQPILARPPSTMYQLRKAVARNKLPAAFAGVLLVTLIAFGVWMSFLYARAEANLDRALVAEEDARHEADTSREVSDFMIDLFEVSDPSEARGNSVTAREILDRGAAHIREDLAGQPTLQSRLMETMGRVYRNLGLDTAALPLLQEAVEVRAAEVGPDHLDVAGVGTTLAGLLIEMERFDDARPILEHALSVQQRELDPLDPEIARTLSNLGGVALRQDDHRKAVEFWDRCLEIREASLGPQHPDVATTLGNLSVAWVALEDYERAGELLRRAIEIRKVAQGEDHPKVAALLQSRAVQLRKAGDLDGALASAEEALAIQERVLEPGAARIGFTARTLAKILVERGEIEVACPYLERSLEIFSARYGAESGRARRVRSELESCLASSTADSDNP